MPLWQSGRYALSPNRHCCHLSAHTLNCRNLTVPSMPLAFVALVGSPACRDWLAEKHSILAAKAHQICLEQDLRNALSQAVELTGQSRDVFKLFWSAQQRFFKLLCISMKACSPADINTRCPARHAISNKRGAT